MNHATNHITAALKATREKKAISQRELSAKTGVPQAQISRLESGAVDIRLSSLVALARALDLEVELVPRKAVSAVETIVRATTSVERRHGNTRTAANELSKLVKAIQGVRSPEIPPVMLEKMLSHIRMLERVQPSAAHMVTIKKLNAVLANTKMQNLDFEAFARHAKAIEHIRNQVVHAPPPAKPPKPAYSLDDEEDDNA